MQATRPLILEPPEREVEETSEYREPWFNGGGPEPEWQRARRQRRRRLIAAGAAGAVLAAALITLVLLVQSAAGHYERGRQALAEERYVAALDEFRGARVLFFSYRDADAIAARLRTIVSSTSQEAWARARTQRAVTGLVDAAASRLADGDAAGVALALADARSRVPRGPLVKQGVAVARLDTLTDLIVAAARTALRDARWTAAGRYAAALLAIDPADAASRSMREKAEKGAGLEARLDAARAAADRREWRTALRLAKSVLEEWPRFPGAARVVQRARAALAPKPSPTPTQESGGGSATPLPSPTVQPSPPQPPPP